MSNTFKKEGVALSQVTWFHKKGGWLLSLSQSYILSLSQSHMGRPYDCGSFSTAGVSLENTDEIQGAHRFVVGVDFDRARS